MSVETWLPVVGYEGSYEVSDLGRVRSLDRLGSSGRRRRGKVLVPQRSHTGYFHVALHLNGVQKTQNIHRLVMVAFGGPEPQGMEVRHRNADRADNALLNLSWGTHAQNMQDQREHGTHKNSVKTHCPSGHPYSGANLLFERNGNRRCAICRQQSWLRTSARRSNERRNAA